jgi:hypothetical protein
VRAFNPVQTMAQIRSAGFAPSLRDASTADAARQGASASRDAALASSQIAPEAPKAIGELRHVPRLAGRPDGGRAAASGMAL